MSIAMLTKYLLKGLGISCSSVKLRPLPKIVDGVALGNFFIEIYFFISCHTVFKPF